ncbi:MAG: putative quinol monooxygenase [Hyphomicrobiaceae bacterium]
MIYVVATMTIKPEKREEVLAAARIVVAETQKETGCQSYDMHVSVTDPNKLVFVERWDDRACLTSHMGMPHFKTWRAVANEAIVARKVEIIAPADVEVM